VPVAAPSALASTYDQATCATIHGSDADDWDRAAIGEDAPAPALETECPTALLVPPPRLDCNNPQTSHWFNDTIGTCDMPRGSNVPQAGMKAARNEGRRARLVIEVAGNETLAPLAPPPDEKPPTPAFISTIPKLDVPTGYILLSAASPRPLGSISGDELLRPPRA
jgi:hypothetical protein